MSLLLCYCTSVTMFNECLVQNDSGLVVFNVGELYQ